LLQEIQPYVITRYALGDYNRLPSVYKKIGKPQDQKSLEWLLRAHIARADWRKLPGVIAQLPVDARDSERWQFWTLRAKQLAGSLQDDDAAALAELAKAASFYGFAAARYTDTNFRLQPQNYRLSEQDIQKLASSKPLRRAIEHFIHGEITEANSNWAQGVRELQRQDWLMAAYLASNLGWHQQAILTAARADAWQHYAIRFPQIAIDEFAQQGLRYNQPPEWFYATARQESALASHARSSAGAVGLMQLLPSTAREVAKSLDREYNKAQLLDANYSIDLGSRYLDQLYQQFGNRALGSAAYNAGPHRVSAWLKNLRKPIPLEAWIETIRFSETRQYVQNILSFGLIHAALYNRAEPGVANGTTITGAAQEQATLSRPWPVFSFIGEPERIVKPYS
ncbi:MAG: lytic transglycosylase domain-containing protein, partial [Pseudomonadales bacterium]|nr:lytic transglycosylase domain-containing protein [Pseudomonadales bacterium]